MTENTNTEACPQCGETYNHFVDNGNRNTWSKGVDFEVCTTADSDWMYVHTQNLQKTTVDSPSDAEAEKIHIEEHDDGPMLRVGDRRILLRTFPKVDRGNGEERVDLDLSLDYDPPNGCWWELVDESGDGPYPWLTIQPEVLRDDE